eukprot:1392169-Amorphochlora_amoeboformis.AAC.1
MFSSPSDDSAFSALFRAISSSLKLHKRMGFSTRLNGREQVGRAFQPRFLSSDLDPEEKSKSSVAYGRSSKLVKPQRFHYNRNTECRS